MAQIERRLGDEDSPNNNRFMISHSQSGYRVDSPEVNVDENRQAPHDSMHASVQLPNPVIPNLSRGQGNFSDDEPEDDEPQVVEV